MNTINFDEINSKFNKDVPSISISKINEYLVKPKDQNLMIDNTYNKHHNNPDSEYYQLTKEQIKENWEQKGAKSRMYGSMLDDYIGVKLTGTQKDVELYKLDNDIDDDERLKGLVSSFENFYATLMATAAVEFVDREKEVIYPMENPMFDESIPESMENPRTININGRFDALFYNKATNKWVIIDWKTSKSIDSKNNFAKLQGPAKFYDDCNHNVYTIQGHFYKTALLANYLPEGTKESDVTFLIVQLPGFVIDNGNNFKIYKSNFNYSKEFMTKIFDFAYKRYTILNKY